MSEKAPSQPRTHAEHVTSLAREAVDPDFVWSSLAEMDAAREQLDAVTSIVDGSGKTTYADIDGNTIKTSKAHMDALADKTKDSHWLHTQAYCDERGVAIAANNPTGMPTSFQDRYKSMRVRRGLPDNTGTFSLFQTSILGQEKVLEAEAEARAFGIDVARDAKIRKIAGIVTRVVATDPSLPDHNLEARMETVEHSTGITKEVVLDDTDIDSVESREPELSVLSRIEAESEAEAPERQTAYMTKVLMNRYTYAVDGQQTPVKGWSTEQLREIERRENEFDGFSLAAKLGVEPLPRGLRMPPWTKPTDAPEHADYTAPLARMRKTGMFGTMYEFIAASRDIPGIVGMVVGTYAFAPGVPLPLHFTKNIAIATAKTIVPGYHGYVVKEREATQQAASDRVLDNRADRQALYDRLMDDVNRSMRASYDHRAALDNQVLRLWTNEENRELAKQVVLTVMKGKDPREEMATSLGRSRNEIERKLKAILPGYDVERFTTY